MNSSDSREQLCNVPEAEENSSTKRPVKVSVFGRLLRIGWRLGCWMSYIVLAYIAIVTIGLIPVNNNFKNTPGGIRVYVKTSAVHSDIIVPIDSAIVNWRRYFPEKDFEEDTSHATHLAIGWGDKGFYIATPDWNDMKVSTVLNALFVPSETCVHAQACHESLLKDFRSVQLNEDQYRKLVEAIKKSLVLSSDGKSIRIPDTGYGTTDAFYEATGNYWCLYTCNSWTGQMLRSAEVRTPWMTPVPGTVFLYLPDSSGTKDSN